MGRPGIVEKVSLRHILNLNTIVKQVKFEEKKIAGLNELNVAPFELPGLPNCLASQASVHHPPKPEDLGNRHLLQKRLLEIDEI